MIHIKSLLLDLGKVAYILDLSHCLIIKDTPFSVILVLGYRVVVSKVHILALHESVNLSQIGTYRVNDNRLQLILKQLSFTLFLL